MKNEMPDLSSLLRPQMAPGNFPACFAFSLHKSGSTLLASMLKDICVSSETPFTNVSAILFDENIPVNEWECRAEIATALLPGYVHIGFRHLPPALFGHDFSQARSILLVRDPRDALVSRYFSFRPKGSHRAPTKQSEEWLKKRDQQRDVEINEYVRNASDLVRRRMIAYHPLLQADLVKVYRYEKIFFDKVGFLKSVLTHFGLAMNDSLVNDVARRHDKRPSQEDQNKHVRKGFPGDYKEKLNPDTIDWLNKYFQEASAPFGYDLTP